MSRASKGSRRGRVERRRIRDRAQASRHRRIRHASGGDGSGRSEAAGHAKLDGDSALEAVRGLGIAVDTRGKVDTARLVRIAEIALDTRVAERRRSGRQEALDALNRNLDSRTAAPPASRREASDAVTRLLSGSLDANGRVIRPVGPPP